MIPRAFGPDAAIIKIDCLRRRPNLIADRGQSGSIEPGERLALNDWW
jgi:hypothetical protein